MTLLEILNELGCTPYTFPEDIDKRIEEMCNLNNYTVLEVPERGCLNYNFLMTHAFSNKEDFTKTRNAVIQLDRINKCNAVINSAEHVKMIVVRSSDFIDYSKEEIELALWHEIGHLVNDTLDERIADEYAIYQLSDIYDNAEYIYLRWLIKEYNVDRTTGKYNFDPIRCKRYEHRKEWIEDYIPECF